MELLGRRKCILPLLPSWEGKGERVRSSADSKHSGLMAQDQGWSIWQALGSLGITLLQHNTVYCHSTVTVITVYCYIITFHYLSKYYDLRGRCWLSSFYRRRNQGSERLRGRTGSQLPGHVPLPLGSVFIHAHTDRHLGFLSSHLVFRTYLLSTFYEIFSPQMFIECFSSVSGTLLGTRTSTVKKADKNSLPSGSLYSSEGSKRGRK